MKTNVFQFKTPSTRIAKPKPVGDKPMKSGTPAEPPIQAVQGVMPGSKQEWRVALALDKLGIRYDFQRSIGGGRSLRGGQVIDFWIYTAPKPTPCFVQGAYWHKAKTESEDTMKQYKVQHMYAGRVMPNLLLQEKDLSSVEAAVRTLRRELIG
jgi:hypothetical protein